MDLHAQLAPIAAEAARTGVKCLPEWLRIVGGEWCIGQQYLGDDAARMIAEASIARTLAERGIAVVHAGIMLPGWFVVKVGSHYPIDDATDYLSALRDAMLRVYATLHDAAKGGK